MQYPISILKAKIKEHEERIAVLKNTDIELISDVFFFEAEIEERESYIAQLQTAIISLHNHDTKR